MALKRILIAVKTYPTLASKYDELVCTAGFLEDGSWIGIYPIPYRKLEYDNQYKKYDWIEINLIRNTSDFRPESYRPVSLDKPIKILGHIGTEGNWKERKEIILKKIFTDLKVLIDEAKDEKKCTSLAVFKPSTIHDFIYEPVERDWDKDKLAKLKARALQYSLFAKSENPFEVVQKLPYKFSFVFSDITGKERTVMIEN